MNNIWVISDTHFFQQSITEFIDYKTGEKIRPGFESADHMDEVLIENWNKVVKPTDTVYHLGDVCNIPDQYRYPDLHKKLNGKKHLVVGNHDDIRFQSTVEWESVNMWIDIYEFNMLLTHVPLEEFALLRGLPGKSFAIHGPSLRTNVHGHIHQNPVAGPNYKCVCVEQTNYTPVNIEDLRT